MRIAVALLIFTTWAVPAKSQPGDPGVVKSSPALEAGDAGLRSLVLMPLGEASSVQAIRDLVLESKGGPDSLRDWSGWLMALAAFVIALFTMLATTYLGRQVKKMRSLERAWIVGSPQVRKFDVPPGPGERLIYSFTLKNVGRTPARILETGFAVRKVESLALIPMEPKYAGTEERSFHGAMLVPNDSIVITATGGEITPDEYTALKNQKLVMYAYGYVKYRDVFERYRETRFCHYCRFPGTGDPLQEGIQLCVEAPKAYNRAT